MKESSHASSNRIPSLDGLRTVSILLVIISHFQFFIGVTDPFNLGSLGVQIFFVISGFLISGLLIKEIDRTTTVNLLKFYFRRTLRIFPPFYFYLLVILIFSVVGWLETPLASFIPAFTYTSNYINPNAWNLNHSWSLAVEEQFYLLYPGVLLLFGKRKIVWLLGFLIVISPLLRILDFHLFNDTQAIWISKGFHANADALAAGCLLAFGRDFLHRNRWYQWILNSKLIFFAPLIIVFANSQVDHPHVHLGVFLTLCNFLIALCIDWSVTHHDDRLAGKFLNSAPMIHLGVMSYSIYLWQQPFSNHQSPAWFTAFPFNILGIALCSTFSFYVVEKFSLRWRQNLEKRWFAKSEMQPSEPFPAATAQTGS